jgi:hypothetical protein
MKLVVAFILSVVWMFGGGFLVRKADDLWRKWEKQRSRREPSYGFDSIISKLYTDATQRQPGRPAPDRDASRDSSG